MKAYVVDSAAVRSNLQLLQTRAGSAVLWAVLKGDGYGLGLLPMAAICREAGVTHFAVTEVSEVSRLRAGGFSDASILMLRPTSEQGELRQLLQLGAILSVSSQNDAAVLNGVAQELGVQAEVHVKIDTGMGRYGFLPDEMVSASKYEVSVTKTLAKELKVGKVGFNQYEGFKIRLTDEEKRWANSTYADTLFNGSGRDVIGLRAMMSGNRWERMSDEERIESVRDMQKTAKKQVLTELVRRKKEAGEIR